MDLARGKNNNDDVSLRSEEDDRVSADIQKIHTKALHMHEKAMASYQSDKRILRHLEKPKYVDIADMELDSLLVESLDRDNYTYIRNLLRQYGKTEAVPQEVVLLDDYNLVRGGEWARRQKVPVIVGLRAWVAAAKYLPEDEVRFKLEQRYCSRSEKKTGAGWEANSLHEIIATAILQRGDLEGEDSIGYDVKPCRPVKVSYRIFSPYKHLSELGEKDIVYIRDGRLQSPCPAHEISEGYLLIRKGKVVDLRYNKYEYKRYDHNLPENSRMTIHQARRHLDPLMVIELTGTAVDRRL